MTKFFSWKINLSETYTLKVFNNWDIPLATLEINMHFNILGWSIQNLKKTDSAKTIF